MQPPAFALIEMIDDIVMLDEASRSPDVVPLHESTPLQRRCIIIRALLKKQKKRHRDFELTLSRSVELEGEENNTDCAFHKFAETETVL